MKKEQEYLSLIKELYFYYNCNYGFYVYDGPERPDKVEVKNIIKEKGLLWSLEYQKIQKKKISEVVYYVELEKHLKNFYYSIKTFEELFELIKITAELLLNKKTDFADLYIEFYSFVDLTDGSKDFFFSGIFPKNLTIVNYFKEKDISKYKELVSTIKNVIETDKFKEKETLNFVKPVYEIIS